MWTCHLPALAVFRTCAIDGLGAGMGGVLWTGISAAEVRAALAIHRVALADRADVAEDVQFMGSAVAHERNERAAREAKRKG